MSSSLISRAVFSFFLLFLLFFFLSFFLFFVFFFFFFFLFFIFLHLLFLLLLLSAWGLTHDHGDDGDDALVDGADGPGGPAALGGAGHDELGNVLVVLGLDEAGGGVQRAHHGLGHGQAQQPVGLVRKVVKVLPREGDDGVLVAAAVQRVGRERDGLVRDLEDDRAHHPVQQRLDHIHEEKKKE